MLLVGNGRLITRDEAFPYAEDGAVALDGEVIKEVGALSELRAKYPDAEFVDARGGVIMPGLINVHTHIYSGLARGLSIDGFNPTNFLEVLDGQWWYIDRHLTLDGTRASAFTGFGLRKNAAPIPRELVLDRPFLCMILDKPTGALLFSGTVNRPDKLA